MISIETFADHFSAWCSKFRHSKDSHLCNAYYRELKKIPEQHFEKLTATILEQEKFPSPKQVYSLWLDQTASLGELEYRYKEVCQVCKGDTLIQYYNGYDLEYALCGYCHKQGFTLQQIRDKGWIPDPLNHGLQDCTPGLAEHLYLSLENGARVLRKIAPKLWETNEEYTLKLLRDLRQIAKETK